MTTLGLPSQPIDKHVVTFWTHAGMKVIKNTATYYVRSSWAEAFPGSDTLYGAPLIDCWLVSGVMGGYRLIGWAKLAQMINDAGVPSFERAYADRGEAVSMLRSQLAQRLGRLQQDVIEVETAIRSLKEDGSL